MKKYGKGWHGESRRHSLASKGIKTGRRVNYAYTASDIPKIGVDAVGTAGASAVGWIPTLVTVGAVGHIAKKGKKIKKDLGYAKEEGYQGWTNRETWAVKLHWDNNQGDYTYFREQAKEFMDAGKPAFKFGDFLQETAEEIQDQVINGEGATEEAKSFINDVGSLWRVDWREIAEAYYDEVKEEEKYEKENKVDMAKKDWRKTQMNPDVISYRNKNNKLVEIQKSHGKKGWNVWLNDETFFADNKREAIKFANEYMKNN